MEDFIASRIKPPMGDGVAATNVRLYAVTTSAHTAAIPAGWAGRYVRLMADGGDVYVLFGSSASLAIDKSLAGTADGKSDKSLGIKLKDGVPEHFFLPSNTTHIAHQGAASVSLWAHLTNDVTDPSA